MTNDNRSRTYAAPFTLSDEELLDELDQLVAAAADGDSRAVGALAIAFSGVLLEEARLELGKEHEQDGGDVLQSFFLDLMAGQLCFPRIRGCAMPWMKRTVRMIARRHKGEAGPEDLAG